MHKGKSGELNFGRLLRSVSRFGDLEAVVDLEREYRSTYREHLDRVAQMAAALSSLGLTPADNLAVLSDASHTYVELWRACCAGAAIINPINTRLAEPEIVDILTDAESTAIVIDPAYAATIDRLRGQLPRLHTVVLDDTAGSANSDVPHDAKLSELLAAQAGAKLPAEPSPDAPAVLMYTGGTTGRSKGVVLSQRAITLSCYRMQPIVDLGERQSYLSFMPMFHVGASSSWSFYLPAGGRTVVLPTFEPGRVNRVIESEQITAIGAVPTMLTMMLDHQDFRLAMLQSLQLIVYGAAPMPPELLARLQEAAPNAGLHQAYGMTEICGVATALTQADHRRGGTQLQSVGRPALGVALELRDPTTAEPTAAGEVGEIWLSSDSLLTEYWKRPTQTADSLIDGWYRTGDAARLDDAGYVYLADRVKDMVVSGGENVYSLEVENAIASHDQVIAAAVIGLEDPQWGERVHAIVQCDPSAVSAAELDAHVRTLIAGYKTPKSWTLQSEELPRSAVGKVLKRVLREQHRPSVAT